MGQEAVLYDFDDVYVYQYTSYQLLFNCGVIMLLSSAVVEFYIFCDGILVIDIVDIQIQALLTSRNDALRY